jgi:hypothetical protein
MVMASAVPNVIPVVIIYLCMATSCDSGKASSDGGIIETPPFAVKKIPGGRFPE